MPRWLRTLLSDQSLRYKVIRGGTTSVLVVSLMTWSMGWNGFWMGVGGVLLAVLCVWWIERQK